MDFTFSSDAWDEYLEWQGEDKKVLKKINELLKDISRNGNTGIGKPEPLKGPLSGWWSRRIDGRHRLVYAISEDGQTCQIIQCRGHYSD